MKINGTIALGALVVCLAFAGPTSETGSENYEQFFEEFFGHFNDHNWEAMSMLYAETAEIKDPSVGTEAFLQTRKDFISHYTELAEMIPDVKDSVVNIYPSGQSVTVEFVSSGTAPDGTKFELPICAILTFEDGLIVKDYVYYDNF